MITALDQHCVGEGASRWVVYVLGLHTDGRTLWIQVAPSEDGSDNIVLQLSLDATAEDAITALGAVQLGGSQYPLMIEVSHRAL